MVRQRSRTMTNLKIAVLLAALALASWRPMKEQKAQIVRAVAAAAMNSVVKAQSADAQMSKPGVQPRIQAPVRARVASRVESRIEKKLAVRVERMSKQKDEHRDCTCRRSKEEVLEDVVTVFVGS